MIDLPPIRFKRSAVQVHEMHVWFCAQTRQAIRFTSDVQRMWWDLVVRFDQAEIHRVLVHIVEQVKKGGHPGQLRLVNFCSLDTFEQRLQSLDAARKLGSVKKPPSFVEKDVEHDGVHRLIQVPAEPTDRPIAQVMPGALREFADRLAKPKDATCDSATDCRTAPAVRVGLDISSMPKACG